MTFSIFNRNFAVFFGFSQIWKLIFFLLFIYWNRIFTFINVFLFSFSLFFSFQVCIDDILTSIEVNYVKCTWIEVISPVNRRTHTLCKQLIVIQFNKKKIRYELCLMLLCIQRKEKKTKSFCRWRANEVKMKKKVRVNHRQA